MTEHEHLLESSLEDIAQYCQTDSEVEARLNLKKAWNAFRDAEEKLVLIGGCGDQYVSGNEFVKAVVIDNTLKA